MAKQQTKDSEARVRERKERLRKHHKKYFGGVKLISIVLLLLGIFGAFFIMADEYGNAFQAVALNIITIWAAIFLQYFAWAVYHYNVNFGLTDEDWEDIIDAQEGNALDSDGAATTEEPQYNPYRSQTFGLPPGTVRGMIAFTLLFGGLALFVASMGMDGEMAENVFFWDHFEFFKTAFLMMVAFYFGSSSLKELSKRWPSTRQAELLKSSGSTEDKPAMANVDLQNVDAGLMDDDLEFAATDGQKKNLTNTKQTDLKETLQKADS